MLGILRDTTEQIMHSRDKQSWDCAESSRVAH